MRLPLLTRLEQQPHPVLHPAWAPRPVRHAAISDLLEQRELRRARRPLHRPPPATRAVLAAPAVAANLPAAPPLPAAPGLHHRARPPRQAALYPAARHRRLTQAKTAQAPRVPPALLHRAQHPLLSQKHI